MVEHLAPGMAVVSSEELGTNCWLPRRFVTEGSRCERVFTCTYPEKHRCQAVTAEIRHLRQEQLRLVKVYINVSKTMRMLRNMLQK